MLTLHPYSHNIAWMYIWIAIMMLTVTRLTRSQKTSLQIHIQIVL